MNVMGVMLKKPRRVAVRPPGCTGLPRSSYQVAFPVGVSSMLKFNGLVEGKIYRKP